MTLPLTPAMLEAAYEYLRATPPFDKWNLPEGEDVKFKVIRSERKYADHTYQDGKHTLGISAATNGWTASLMASVAHEMVHIYQVETGLPHNHGVAFKKIAERVCKFHGFDPKVF